METINKKLANGLILIFSIAALLATIAHAAPFTEAFKGGLMQINDFFSKENYKTYAKAIDFFIFSLLFTAIYMRGVKFAFKEVKRTEQLIAVLLGLTTAFLLVLGDYSILSLLPFVNWLLFFLLFVLIWWLLKEMKSKFWRFVLALLLTLLIIFLAQLLFEGFTTPSVSGVGTGLSGVGTGECFTPSGTILNPLLLWLLYFVIFLLFFFLFKDMKNTFGRFLLSLILTPLLILLLHGIFGGFIAFDFYNCPGTFARDFGAINFGPSLLSDSTLKQIPPPDISLKQIEPPGQKKDDKGNGLTVGESGERTPEALIGDMFGVDWNKYSDKQEFQKVVRERGKEGTRVEGQVYYPGTKDEKLILTKDEGGISTVVDPKDYVAVVNARRQFESQEEKKFAPLAQLFDVKKGDMGHEDFKKALLSKGGTKQRIYKNDYNLELDKNKDIILKQDGSAVDAQDYDKVLDSAGKTPAKGSFLGNFFEVKITPSMTQRQYDDAVTKAGAKGKQLPDGHEYYTEEGAYGKPVFQQSGSIFGRYWPSAADPEKDPALKQQMESDMVKRLRQQEVVPPAPTGAQPSPAAPAQKPPGEAPPPPQSVPPKSLEPAITPITSGSRTGQTGEIPVSKAGISGTSWLGIALLLFVILFFSRNKIRGVLSKRKGKEKTIQDILRRIEEVYKNKKNLIDKLTSSQKRKETLILSHDEITAYLGKIAEEIKKGEVYWYEEEPRLEEEKGSVGGLNEIERQWVAETRELIKLEIEFIKSIREWRVALRNANIGIEEEYAELEQLIVRAKDSILVLLLRLYGKETQLEHTEEELLLFLDKGHRAELIREKHKFLKDAAIVKIYVEEEGRIIKTVGEKIEDQNKLLAQLQHKISEAVKIGISRRAFLAGGAATEPRKTVAPTQSSPPKGLEPTVSLQ